MESTVKAARGESKKPGRVAIGGPPTTDEFARKIGADFRGRMLMTL
jgi:methanogenic corrinoid protein MtbC1